MNATQWIKVEVEPSIPVGHTRMPGDTLAEVEAYIHKGAETPTKLDNYLTGNFDLDGEPLYYC
jgi:hypothetical protein